MAAERPPQPAPGSSAGGRDLLREGARRLTAVHGRETTGEKRRWLLVDVTEQRLLLVREGAVERDYPVSTAAAGIDGTEGSHGTPPGLHVIERKIGAGLPAGTVFVSRVPTGDTWPADRNGQASEGDLVLSRILTLAGQEEGVNRGPGCDSLARYIYIHGTNHEDRIGEPVSHGCIRLRNADVIDLFARVEEGDPVVIL